MRAVALLLLLLSSCSSAPAPERSTHADGRPQGDDVAAPGDRDAGAAPAATTADDVPEPELAALRQRLGCTREGPALPGSRGVACGLLGRFARGRAPTWAAGAYPGVVLRPAADAPDVARPALLAVRGAGAGTEVAWGVVSPDDPRQATDLAAAAAAVLEGQAPSTTLAPWPGLAWSRSLSTRGASAQIGSEPRIFARAEDGATIVLVWDEETPLVALHRAPAAAP